MADDLQPDYALQEVDYDPFGVGGDASAIMSAVQPAEPAPPPVAPVPRPTTSPDDYGGAIGGLLKAAQIEAHGGFTGLAADKLADWHMPTQPEFQRGEEALGHAAEAVVGYPEKFLGKLGTILSPTQPETPGTVSESDIERERARAEALNEFGVGTGFQMVAGGPGSAEEAAAGVAGGKLRQPDVFPMDRSPTAASAGQDNQLWMWEHSADHPDRIDQRIPTAKTPVEVEGGGPRLANVDAMRATPDLFDHNIGLVRDYPGVNIPKNYGSDKAAEAFVEQAKNNLVWLHNQVPEDIRARSALWYDGANKIANDLAQKYDVTESQAAGVLAALSPQKDWYVNRSLADRVLNVMKGGGDNFYKGFVMSPEMEESYANTPALQKYPEFYNQIQGKTLADIDQIIPFPKDERAVLKAMWIRLHDQAHADPMVNAVSPEGNILPQQTQRVAWGSLPEIAKAVSIVDGDGAIGDLVGKRNKVRNFYNNILTPNSPYGDVTIDTHAVGAALLRPFSSQSTEVAHALGNSLPPEVPVENAKNSAKTGVWGTYPLYADAYRRAAAELGIQPRQLQSITWEAVRGLFPEDWKSGKNSAIIDNIWRQSKKVGIDETRQRVLTAAGGIKPPTWYTQSGLGLRPSGAADAAAQGAGNAAELSGPSVYGAGTQGAVAGAGRGATGKAPPPVRPQERNVSYELDFGAGAPYNEQYPEWGNLSGDQKAQIATNVLPKITDFAKELTGANEYARVYGLGGWHEFTNPAFKSRLVATPEQAGDFADTLGYLAQQTKIFGYRADPAGEKIGVELLGHGLGDQAKLAKFWQSLNERYPDFASGFSPTRNAAGVPGIEMLLDEGGAKMAQRVKDELIPALSRLAGEHGLGNVEARDFKATEESREHDWQQDPSGSGYLQRLSARHGPDVQSRLDLFRRQELEPELRRQIDSASGGRGTERSRSVSEAQGAPAVPFRAAAKNQTLGSGATDEEGNLRAIAAARASADQAAAGRPKLIGLPDKPIMLEGKPYVPGPVGYLHDIAEQYMSDAGLPYDPPKTYVPVDKGRAGRIAQAFDDMKHAPDDPATKASYDALINETVAQYKALKNAGVKFEFIKPGQPDPYGANPRLAAQDVAENKHLWVFPTEGGFGSGTESAEAAMKGNPLLRPTDEYIDGHRLLANDVFRIVHDMFGHLKDGNGFRSSGEENAWRSHSAMYSDAARPAMTSETRGQNSWVNYGPHGDANRTALSADTKYADQKIGLLPQWAIDEGRKDIRAFHGSPYDFNAFDSSKIGTGEGNQSFGHGLYFAENPKVAEEYKKVQPSTSVAPRRTFQGRELEPGSPQYHAGTLLETTGRSLPGVKKEVQGWIDNAKPGEDVKHYQGVLDTLNAAKSKKDFGVIPPSGNVYEVSLASDPSHFLDLDKPWEQQSDHVKRALGPFVQDKIATSRVARDKILTRGTTTPSGGRPLTGSEIEKYKADLNIPTGQKLYDMLQAHLGAIRPGEKAAEASEHLQSLGIPGIKYLDLGSRLDGDAAKMVEAAGSREAALQIANKRLDSVAKSFGVSGDRKYWSDIVAKLRKPQTSNYVIFNDKLANIVKKNGVDQLVKSNASHFQTEPVEGDPFKNDRADGGAVADQYADFRRSTNVIDDTNQSWGDYIAGLGRSAVHNFEDNMGTMAQDVQDAWQHPFQRRGSWLPPIPPTDDPMAISLGANEINTQARAHGGRVEPKNIDHSPSPAQAASGNYQKDHVAWRGLNLTIENSRGSVRRGIDKNGKPWRCRLPAHYGYIKRTVGKDGDHVDAYLGPHPKSENVYLIDQVDAASKKFDEHKAMLNFTNRHYALDAYRRAFSDGKGHERIGAVHEMSVAQFKHWLENGDTKKPFRHTADHKDALKLSHDTVGYASHWPDSKRQCGVCSMFIKPQNGGPGCSLVRRPIEATAHCRRWQAKT